MNIILTLLKSADTVNCDVSKPSHAVVGVQSEEQLVFVVSISDPNELRDDVNVLAADCNAVMSVTDLSNAVFIEFRAANYQPTRFHRLRIGSYEKPIFKNWCCVFM